MDAAVDTKGVAESENDTCGPEERPPEKEKAPEQHKAIRALGVTM